MDNKNKIKKSIKHTLKENEIMKINYICDKEGINLDKINFEMNYLIKDKKFQKKYEIVPYLLPKGEELSKLIVYENILKNNVSIFLEL